MIKAYKRLIAILTAAVMTLCAGVINISAAEGAEADAESVAETEAVISSEDSLTPKVRKMMTVLKTFDIIPDYYDYNFPQNYEVSRSDFAASVARMMGKTTYSGSEIYFYDVPKNYWAYNEISNLTQMGILNGSGDRTFDPGAPITRGAAYKILLCAMGYGEYAQYFGGYPDGYIIAANRIKLSDGASGNEKVTMADMLQILYNALTVNIAQPSSVKGDTLTYEVVEGETLISQSRDIYYGEGDVNGANTVTLSGGDLNIGETLIGSDIYKCNGFDMMEYLGEKIEFFYENDDSAEEKKLLWIGRKSSQNVKYISVDGDANLDTDSFVYTYYDANEKRHTINLDRSTLLIYNGGIVESGFDRILNNKRYELKLITNNNKHTMVVREYENYVVGNINSMDCVIYDKNVPGDSLNLREEDYDTFSIKLMGDNEISFDDIMQGAVLTVYLSKDKKHIEVYACYNFAEGTFENIYEDKNRTIAAINGTEYRIDKKVPINDYSVGDNVTVYTDVYGDIAYITVKAGSLRGAFLLKSKLDDREENLYIKLLGEDSKVTTLKCVEKPVIDGTKYKNLKDAHSALLAGESKLAAQFALIDVNEDGEIREIDTAFFDTQNETSNSLQIDVPFMYGSEVTYTQRLIRANSNATRIGEKIVFSTDTKVFIVPYVSDYDNVSDDELWVTVGSKLANDTGTYAQSYKTADDIGITKYLLLKGYDPSRVNVELPILANKIVSGIDDDGNNVEVLVGYQGASPVRIRADGEESNLFSKAGVQQGDVVRLTKDYYGHVKDCSVAYDYRTGAHKAISVLNDNMGMFVGYANNVVDNVVKIGYASGAECDFAINALTRPVLVYDTSNPNNPISVASIGDIVTYRNDPVNCSTVLIVTSRMQPQMFIVYK